MTTQFRLVVLFGGESAEHDVSCVTARHVVAAVDSERFVVDPIGITRAGQWRRSPAAGAIESGDVASLPSALEAVGTEIEPLSAVAPLSLIHI